MAASPEPPCMQVAHHRVGHRRPSLVSTCLEEIVAQAKAKEEFSLASQRQTPQLACSDPRSITSAEGRWLVKRMFVVGELGRQERFTPKWKEYHHYFEWRSTSLFKFHLGSQVESAESARSR